MRVVLVTGPDGSTVSTLAAATALRCAHDGVKVQLVALCPGAGLGDVLTGSAGGGAVATDDPVPGLQVHPLDPHGAVARRSAAVGSAFGVEPDDWPGVEDLGVLLALRDTLTEAAADVLVVDAGPSDALLRLMAAAHTLPPVIARTLPRVAALAATDPSSGSSSSTAATSTWQSLLRGVGSALGVPTVTGWSSLLAVLSELNDDLHVVLDVLTDPARCSVQFVADATGIGAARMRRAVPALALHRLGVAEVVAVGADPDGLAAERRELSAVSWRRCPERPTVGGVPVLTSVGEAVWAVGVDPAGCRTPSSLRTEPDGDEFVLVLPLPLVDPSTVTAGRRGDDLEVHVGAHRGVLPLTPVLRRCTIVGGGVSDGALRLRFRPDPAQWPSGLS